MDKLEELILRHRNERFLVIEPGGNNGDRLIYMGMEKKLRELGIDYVTLRYVEKPPIRPLHTLYWVTRKITLHIIRKLKPDSALEIAVSAMYKKIYEKIIVTRKIQTRSASVVLVHGGSNVNDLHGHGIRLLKNVIRHNPSKIIIVAPQTYWFRETRFPDVISNARQEIHLFCRERDSYSLLSSMNRPENVHVELSHDTAFYLSRDDFHPKAGSYDLICLREDEESLMFSKPQYLRDLQDKTILDLKGSETTRCVGDISLLPDFREFVRLIKDSKKVYTDRLHVAILAAILGKDTVLYPNSYFKTKGVFDFSLRFRYPNLRFVEIDAHSDMIQNERTNG